MFLPSYRLPFWTGSLPRIKWPKKKKKITISPACFNSSFFFFFFETLRSWKICAWTFLGVSFFFIQIIKNGRVVPLGFDKFRLSACFRSMPRDVCASYIEGLHRSFHSSLHEVFSDRTFLLGAWKVYSTHESSNWVMRWFFFRSSWFSLWGQTVMTFL